MSSLEALVRDFHDLVFTKPDDRERVQALASNVLSALDDAKAEALEVGDNATDDDDSGGDVDRTFAAVRDGVPDLVETAVATKIQTLRDESSRIAQWNELRNRLRRIRACAADRTQGKQVRRYVEWCVRLLEAFRAASDFFPPERDGTGLTERRERGVFRDEVLPRYIPNLDDTLYGRALSEESEPRLRGYALPKLERLQKALKAAAQAAIRVPQGGFWGTDEARELSNAVMECHPLTAGESSKKSSPETHDRDAWIECSDSCRSVRCDLKSGEPVHFSFTPSQALFLQTLWENHERGLYDVTKEALRDVVFSDSVRSSDRVDVLFRAKGSGYHDAWRTLIIPGGSKGTYRLAEQSTFEDKWNRHQAKKKKLRDT